MYELEVPSTSSPLLLSDMRCREMRPEPPHKQLTWNSTSLEHCLHPLNSECRDMPIQYRREKTRNAYVYPGGKELELFPVILQFPPRSILATQSRLSYSRQAVLTFSVGCEIILLTFFSLFSSMNLEIHLSNVGLSCGYLFMYF